MLSYVYSIYILYYRVVTQNRFFPGSWLDDGAKSVVRTGSKMARNVSAFFFQDCLKKQLESTFCQEAIDELN